MISKMRRKARIIMEDTTGLNQADIRAGRERQQAVRQKREQ